MSGGLCDAVEVQSKLLRTSSAPKRMLFKASVMLLQLDWVGHHFACHSSKKEKNMCTIERDVWANSHGGPSKVRALIRKFEEGQDSRRCR